MLTTAALLGISVLLGWARARPAVSPVAVRELVDAAAYFDSTIVLARAARPRGARGDALTIALGYLERLRLGLRDPFALADEALRDPRLDAPTRARVAWALLARTRRGDAYVIDPVVLDGAGPWSADGHGSVGAAHLALIEQAVRSASDPRAGELAVRLAYTLEASKGKLATSAVSAATQTAALVRDRVEAEADVRDLLVDANEQHADVLQLATARRSSRSLRVEQPPLLPLSAELQTQAIDAVPALLRALDTLDRVTIPAVPVRADRPVMGPYFALRLATLGANQPPVAPVVVTLAARAAAPLVATNDETLAAANVITAQPTDSAHRASALAVLSTAVALRSLAQQEPWFVGDVGPTASDLSAEFGLASVTFARSTPLAWRPYYLRELETALGDMRQVFPGLSVNGLRVRYTADRLRDSALAMHDPSTRTLQLSIATSGGTIAHELSHDLDWQAARWLYPAAGGYSTDWAMRDGRGLLASSVTGLAEARLLRPFSATRPLPEGDRPAELFARGVDWFVATTLAASGRSNGFLTAVQDAVLGGYAAGAATVVGSAGTQSLLSAIAEMTFVPDSARQGFVSQWADPAMVDPMLLVRRVIETPISTRGTWEGPGARWANAELPATLCMTGDSPAMRARERLLLLAVDARAEGIAARRARFRPAGMRSDWANSVLGAVPFAPEPGARMVHAFRAAIAGALATALSDQGVVPVVPAIFRSSAASCSVMAR